MEDIMKTSQYLLCVALLCLVFTPAMGATWERANTHAHTTYSSDGTSSLATVVSYYKSAYNVLAVTDHNRLSSCYSSYSDLTHSFLCLNSYEWSGSRHLAMINVGSTLSTGTSIQTVINSAGTGGFAILNHPGASGVTVSELLSYKNLPAMEIYNGKRNTIYTTLWDRARVAGSTIFRVAADDEHTVPGDGAKGWTVVGVSSLSSSAYVSAMKAGNFYSTQGPTMNAQPFQLRCDGVTVGMGKTATCSAVSALATVSASTSSGKISRIDLVKNGKIVSSKTSCPTTQTCSFTFTDSAVTKGYYRLQAQDSAGKRIWSNPIWVNAVSTSTSTSTLNHAPVLATIGSKTVTTGSTLTFTISATDADGNPLTYRATGLPSGATFTASTRTFTWKPASTQVGSYKVNFSVSDGKAIDSEIVTITVTTTNHPPVLAPIGAKSVVKMHTLSFTISATDPDKNPLTYSATGLPSGATFSPSTRTFRWTPTTSQVGTYYVTFKVSDGKLTDSERVTITVRRS